MMFALFVLFASTGSIAYADIFAKAGSLDSGTIITICIALFVAAAAKSAQVPLHTWLPDAMEGPTPVSALIHAATMVTAGVYLIARFAPLWNASPAAQEMAGGIGAATMLLGAVLGMAQWDIKRILAYSTMSQIGYMIMGVGVGAYQAGVLHFFTHAFFKAQLFLGAGIVIHALHDEQDVRKMGGLYRTLPFAFWAMLLGTLAITGFPLFSGFYSKDAVIYGALEHGHPWLYAAGAATAGITAYYMFRMIFLTFFGPDRARVPDPHLGIEREPVAAEPGEHESHPDGGHGSHAPGWLMQAPVAILMVPTVIAGYLSIGGTASPWYRFFGASFGKSENAAGAALALPEWGSTVMVLVLVAAGIVAAYLRYGAPEARADAVDRLRIETLAMPAALKHAFYFDDAIDALVVRPARRLGTVVTRFVDPHVIDAGVRDVAWLAGVLGLVVRALQNGLVRTYALTIVIGAGCFIVYFALAGAAR
jgi:NADH-quinone oxidoreductase subunit L